MAKKYVDNDGLLYFWQKIKNTFAKTSDVPTKTSDLTNDSGYITSADVPEGAAASTTTPKMDGTAAAGSETAFARGDHVHPVDTSRAPTSHASTGTTYGKGTGSNYGHVKLSDSTTATTAAASGGTAATPKAVSDALKAAKSYADGLDTGVSDVTVDGTSVVTGGVAAVDLSGKVPTSRTVNGKALSANITLTGADIDYANGEVTIDTAISTLDNSKVDKETGKGLSTNDYTTTEKNKLAGIASGAEANVQPDWSQTDTTADDYIKNKPTIPAAVTVDSALSDTSTNPVQNKVIKGALADKVDVESGKGLSTNDYTTTEKNKLAGITSGATKVTVGILNGYVRVTYNDSNAYDIIQASKIGAANGVAPLNASSKIDSTYLPSYVDDVIEAYARSGQTALSQNWLATGSASGTVITPEAGKIYVLMADSGDYTANSQFRWGGSTYVKMNDGGMSPITNAEIDTIVAS